MNLRDQIDAGLKAAMKAGNDDRKRVLRLLLAAVKLVEVEKGESLDDPILLTLVQKEIKIRKESLEGAEAAQRADLIAINRQEIAILEEFLPQQLSDSELLELVRQVISEVGAELPSDTGKVMKNLLPKVQGRAPNDKVSLFVRQALQNH